MTVVTVIDVSNVIIIGNIASYDVIVTVIVFVISVVLLLICLLLV